MGSTKVRQAILGCAITILAIRASVANSQLAVDNVTIPVIKGSTHADVRLLKTVESFDYDCSDNNHYRISFVRGPGDLVSFESLATGNQAIASADVTELNDWINGFGHFYNLTSGCDSNGLTVELAMFDGSGIETSATFHISRGNIIFRRVKPR